MNFILIDNEEQLTEVCERLRDAEWIGLDIETTALDPFDGSIRLIQLCDGQTTYVVDLFKTPVSAPFKLILPQTKPRKVIHNAKFDAKWIKHHLDIEVGGIFCTMLASQLLAAGDMDHKHSLVGAALRYLNQVVDKTEQVSDWGKRELDIAQIEYAAKDAAILLPLKDAMLTCLEDMDMLRTAELENECVMPVLQMELNGFFLDWTSWLTNVVLVEAKADMKSRQLQARFGAFHPHQNLFNEYNINLGSPKQVTEALKWAGVPVSSSTQEWKLRPLANNYDIVALLLEYRGLDKARSSYGRDWEKHINPSTGRVHATFDQARAKTGRFGCSNPNLQQIPKESEYRSCFKAEDGNTLIVADYSQIELRILADRSGDSRFISAFNSGEDLHRATASQVLGIPLSAVTTEQRTFAKGLNFGIVYGIGASRFAAITDMARSEADELMGKYFSTFTELNAYLRDTGRQSIVDRSCRTASGRMLKLRFDENDNGSVSAAKRNGVNMPIQGTSADILKRALRLVHDALKPTSGRIVNIVHDEIVVECLLEEAQAVSSIVKECMIAAGIEYVKKVPVEVEATISDVWKK